MTRSSIEPGEAATSRPPDSAAASVCPGPASFLLLSAWCGLVAGLLEVAAIIVRKRYFDSNQLYQMSHHFVWLIPATNLCLFALAGALGVVLMIGARRVRGAVLRALCGLTLLPAALVAFPRLHAPATLLVALGLASWLVPLLERRARSFGRIVRITSPALAALVLIAAAVTRAGDRPARWREPSRPLPPPGSPNVLLVVMDTVAAGHLGLYGYDRPTSTAMDELAGRGIRFASAQAASSWTLPSHATMFTGRWLHELSVGWLTPLDGAQTTLAGYLGAKGYETAGFVANTQYCGRDSGLGRGFQEYRDFIFPGLTAFKKTALVSRALAGIEAAASLLEEQFGAARTRDAAVSLLAWFNDDRKPAAIVNRELLDWLSRRARPGRPFFAFLNYFDAHYPYLLPDGRFHRFGGAPGDARERTLVERWGDLDKRRLSPADVAFAARAYDDCIADLDEQVGWLTDRLRRDGVLDHTWLIIVADHGESFGEHAGVFCHGTSLYRSEVHVPLIIVPPGGRATGLVVDEPVSTRDLAATIAELAGQASEAPFPGQSLARYWSGAAPAPAMALAEVMPDPGAPQYAGSAGPIWPLGAVREAEWKYIRREGDIREELFRVRDDLKEEHNLASDAASRPALEQLRNVLARMTAGPLLPQRFRP